MDTLGDGFAVGCGRCGESDDRQSGESRKPRRLRPREGREPGGIEDRFEDPLWKKLAGPAAQGGHGGMDYVMNWRLVQCLLEGLAPDMDVYDAAAWSAPSALSEKSVAGGNVPIPFPDFTRGRWGEPRRV